MKRVVLFVVVVLFSLVLSACGGATTPTKAPDQPVATSAPANPAATKAPEQPVATTAPTAASNYPEEPIEIIAPANPGGGWDTLARTIQVSLETEKLVPQPLSVTNKPGGGGAVGLAYMVNQKGTNNTLVVYSPPLIILNINGTFEGKSYKDLTPLAKLITDYQVIVVKADSPYKTLEDLLKAMRANPKAVKFAGVSSPGSMDHVAFAKIAKAAGIDPKAMDYIAFAGGGEATTALLGGNVAFLSTGIGESVAQLEAGTIRALAITAPERLKTDLLKDVPTVKESGYDVTYEIWRGVFGPADMSPEAKAYWEATLKKMVESPTWKAQLVKLNWRDAYANSADFTTFLGQETEMYRALLTELGFAK
jgi:putative tricarboxylic transport membrane protein